MTGPKARKASYGSAEKPKKLSAEEKRLVQARVFVEMFEAAEKSGGPCRMDPKEYLKMKELLKKSQENPIFSPSKKTGCSFGSPTKKTVNVGSPSPSRRGVRFNEDVDKNRYIDADDEDWDGNWFTPMETKEQKTKSPSRGRREEGEDVAVTGSVSGIVPVNPWPLFAFLALLGVSHMFQWFVIAFLVFKHLK